MIGALTLLALPLALAGEGPELEIDDTSDDPVIAALEAEMDRGLAELSLEDAEGPYHVGLVLVDLENAMFAATLGGLLTRSIEPSRRLGTEGRMGSKELDNSNFEAFRDGFGARRVVLGDDPMALRHDAWLLLDA